jgi:WD40 repeat protein
VVLASVSDGKETAHFEFQTRQPRSWREFEFGGNDGVRTTFTTTAVSPDGRYLVAVSVREGAVLVYDLNLEKLLHTLAISTSTPTEILISPDSKNLLIYEQNKPLSRYELVSGKQLPPYTEPGFGIATLAISPDSKRAVTIGYTEELDPQTLTVARIKETGDLIVRDAANGKPIGKLPVGGSIYAYQFVGPESILVAHSTPWPLGDRSCIARWNTVTLQREWESVIPRGVSLTSLRVSSDGKQFALLGNHVISLGDAATGKTVVPAAAHTGPVKWIAFSADGQTITTAGGEELFVWAINGERKQLNVLPELSRGRGRIPAGLSEDHLVLVASGEDAKKLELVGWDREKAQIGWRMPYEGNVPENLCSHDGKRVVVLGWDKKWEDWQASVYDGPKSKLIDDWTVPFMPPNVNAANRLNELQNQLHPNGFQPGFGKGGGGIGGGGKGGGGMGGGGMGNNFQLQQNLRELQQSLLLRERTGPDWCHPITLSGDGSTIFVAGSKLVALDAVTGRKKVRIGGGTLDPALASEGSLAASADGALLAVADSSSLRVVDLKSGKHLMEREGHFLHRQMKFSPDGKRLAVWSPSQQQLSLYDLRTGAKPLVLDGGLSPPTCCAFNSVGTSLAVGYEDGTSLVWDLTAK